MPRQFESCDSVINTQGLSKGLPDSAIHPPTMEQHQVRSGSNGFSMQFKFIVIYSQTVYLKSIRSHRLHAGYIDAPSTSSNRSTWSSVCNAEKVIRRRALPSGTVGGRIALTQMPCSSNCRLQAKACSEEPASKG